MTPVAPFRDIGSGISFKFERMAECRAPPSSVRISFEARLASTTSSESPIPSLCSRTCALAGITGAGRLLDLACGTGQITFGLASNFIEIWAVDQEPEAVEFARAKALRRGVGNVRWIAGRAEEVDAHGYFELVAVGNAFHRLQRSVIAESAMRWLIPVATLLCCGATRRGTEVKSGKA